MLRELSAGGVVGRDGRLLLVNMNNLQGERVWTFPKGHLDPGETAERAALREVEEETGWRCELLRPMLTVAYRFSRGGALVAKRVRWFAMKPSEKVCEPDWDEINAVRWATPAQARKLLKYPGDFELLKRWEVLTKQPGTFVSRGER